jgi:type 1 fimbria pilin
MPFDNATAVAIKCVLQLNNAGAFTASPCTSYGVVAGDGGNVNISGQFTLTGCQITGGSITVPGDPAVTILGGYVNPTQKNGAGIARQGAGSVFLFNMVKP